MNQYKTSFLGYFNDNNEEYKYLQSASKEIIKQNRVFSLATGTAYLIAGLGDFFKLGFSDNLFVAILLRLILFLFCLWLYFYKPVKTNLKINLRYTTIMLIMASMVVGGIMYPRNPDRMIDPIDMFVGPLVLLFAYLLINIPILYLIANGIFITVFYIVYLNLFFDTTRDTIIHLSVIFIFINTIGIYLNSVINKLRRKDYLNNLTILTLNENLKTEIIERKKVQIKLEETLEQVTDNINYAKSIQLALLPPFSLFRKDFDDCFIYYKPKNIVSGDFYWTFRTDSHVYVAVVDCTGHGVSGALLSMLGYTLLNNIVLLKNLLNPAEILNEMRTDWINLLESQATHSGMNIVLISIDNMSKEMTYAGSYHQVHVVNKNKLEVLETDKIAIAYDKRINKQFNNYNYSLEKDDMIYLSTDGFRDQFNENDTEKFRKNRFNDLLKEICTLPLEIQNSRMDLVFNTWKGDTEQIDDVLVMGLRVN